MKCALCGFEFEEKNNQACKGCPIAGACHMIKCPNCGYEMPAETGLIKALKALRSNKNDGIGRKS